MKETNLWFTANFDTKNIRNIQAQFMISQHNQWRIDVHKTYKNQCDAYLKNWLLWEWRFLNHAFDAFELFYWSNEITNEKRIFLTDSTEEYASNLLAQDSKVLVEKKDFINQFLNDESVSLFFRKRKLLEVLLFFSMNLSFKHPIFLCFASVWINQRNIYWQLFHHLNK